MDEQAKIHLIESDETEPKVRLAAGKRYEVFATSIIDHDLKAIAEEAKEPRQRPPACAGADRPALRSSRRPRSSSATAAVSDSLATSRYTFRLPVVDGFAVYNASTGAVLRLAGADADELSALLSGPPIVVETARVPQRRGGDDGW